MRDFHWSSIKLEMELGGSFVAYEDILYFISLSIINSLKACRVGIPQLLFTQRAKLIFSYFKRTYFDYRLNIPRGLELSVFVRSSSACR